MARRAKGEGCYVHLLPIKCEECKKFKICLKRIDPAAKCQQRDRKDFWVYQYSVKGADGKRVRKALYGSSKKELVQKVASLKSEQDSASQNDITFGDCLEMWKTKYLPKTVRKNTQDFYSYMLRYIPEKLGYVTINS